METKRGLFAGKAEILTAGAVIGLAAVLLQYAGNPANMGVCVACFLRDIAGALGLHRAAPVQYLRPEIPAFVLGSLAADMIGGEFRALAHNMGWASSPDGPGPNALAVLVVGLSFCLAVGFANRKSA